MKKNSEYIRQTALDWLEGRNVTIEHIAELVYFLQKSYFSNLTLDMCREHVEKVLEKKGGSKCDHDWD